MKIIRRLSESLMEVFLYFLFGCGISLWGIRCFRMLEGVFLWGHYEGCWLYRAMLLLFMNGVVILRLRLPELE